MSNREREPIDAALVRALLRGQFPEWAELPIEPAVPQGWDNRTFRLGETMSVRLPSAAGYVAQVEKEHRFLPYLAPRLPLPIPAPLAQGRPDARFPWPWSVYRWLPGESAATAPIADLAEFAAALAAFLVALQRIDPTNGPPAGAHSAFRGAPLRTYDAETRRAIVALGSEIDDAAATALWETALGATWHGPALWFHGDVAVGNLLVREGRLSAVIDFGCCGVGDPACDLVIAWTLFEGRSRERFRAAMAADEGAWRRGRGWALWKALITLEAYRDSDRARAEEARRVIDEVLADHAAGR